MTNSKNIWTRIFDIEYAKINTNDFVSNTNVWRKFGSNEIFSNEEMNEWLANTYTKIAWLTESNSRVLEIGCGNGLISKYFSDKDTEYVGIDPSEIAVEKLRNYFRDFNNMIFYHSDALEFKPGNSKFDLIVINSVIQYYPNLNYFLESIILASSWLAKSGVIFIGDIRSLPHENYFIKNSNIIKNLGNNKVPSKLIKPNNEIIYHPHLFKILPNFIPNIIRVLIDIKRGKILNELSKYRFDVFLFNNNNPKIQNLNELDYKNKLFINSRITTQSAYDLLAKEKNVVDGKSHFEEEFNGTKFIDFDLNRNLNFLKINQYETVKLEKKLLTYNFTNKNQSSFEDILKFFIK